MKILVPTVLVPEHRQEISGWGGLGEIGIKARLSDAVFNLFWTELIGFYFQKVLRIIMLLMMDVDTWPVR